MTDVLWMFNDDNKDCEADLNMMLELRFEVAEIIKAAEKMVSSYGTENYEKMARLLKESIIKAKARRYIFGIFL